ncbi:hypothetical protein M569_13962, partial [Genlisea aurea]
LAVDYAVTNNAASTPGGARYATVIGDAYALQTLGAATDFVWRVFQQNSDADRKQVSRVGLFIDDMGGVAYAVNGEIHFSARYV